MGTRRPWRSSPAPAAGSGAAWPGGWRSRACTWCWPTSRSETLARRGRRASVATRWRSRPTSRRWRRGRGARRVRLRHVRRGRRAVQQRGGVPGRPAVGVHRRRLRVDPRASTCGHPARRPGVRAAHAGRRHRGARGEHDLDGRARDHAVQRSVRRVQVRGDGRDRVPRPRPGVRSARRSRSRRCARAWSTPAISRSRRNRPAALDHRAERRRARSSSRRWPTAPPGACRRRRSPTSWWRRSARSSFLVPTRPSYARQLTDRCEDLVARSSCPAARIFD